MNVMAMRTLILAATAGLMTGCGGTGEDNTVVTGMVTLGGNPLADAVILFLPQIDKDIGNRIAKTDAVGRFTIQDTGSSPIKPGSYLVLVNKFTLDTEGNIKNEVPERYRNPKLTPLKVEIVPGHNRLSSFAMTDAISSL